MEKHRKETRERTGGSREGEKRREKKAGFLEWKAISRTVGGEPLRGAKSYTQSPCGR